MDRRTFRPRLSPIHGDTTDFSIISDSLSQPIGNVKPGNGEKAGETAVSRGFSGLCASAYFTVILSRCQMSSTYSWMVRSELNLPLLAVFSMALLAQAFSSLYLASTLSWAAA